MGLFEEVFDITANILGKKYKTCPGCNEPISIYHNQTICNNDRLDRRSCKKCGDKIVRGSEEKLTVVHLVLIVQFKIQVSENFNNLKKMKTLNQLDYMKQTNKEKQEKKGR